MKYFLHINLVTALLASGCYSSFLSAQSNVLTLSADETGTSPTHVACKEIRLLPGYRYAAQPGKSMRAYIDPYMICNVDYISGFSSTTPPPLNTSLEVGTTPGSFVVTQTGAATYNIPLVVPPGTAGMVPNLSISYNSYAGDGLLGTGWPLSGLSAITRVGKTLYHDGSIAPVKINSEDRFALDGNRLFTDGTYGASGTVYGTEAETFSKITSMGSYSGGPSHFIVETKDGSILEYGTTNDSRIELDELNLPYGGVVFTWLLHKVQDAKGNYIKIHYTENRSDGTFRPDYIEYTGNFNFPTLTPYNIIKFVYGTRQDKQEYWVAGHKVQQNVLLTAIEIYAQGTLVHKYEFNYSYSIGSHLSEVIEKGTDGKQFNSTKFVYETLYNIHPSPSSFSMPINTGIFSVVDFDGDGLSDLVRTTKAQLEGDDAWYQYRNNGNGNFTQIGGLNQLSLNFSPIAFRARNTFSSDLNGDGLDDMLLYTDAGFNMLGQKVNDPSYKVLYSNGTSLYEGLTFNYDEDDGNGKFVLGDFDGDGATDLFVHFYWDHKTYFRSFKNGTQFTYTHNLGNEKLNFYTTDLNGDGKNEVLYTFDNPWTQTNYFQVLELQGSTFQVTGAGNYPNGSHTVFPGDFNGDGKTDILTWGPGEAWVVGYSMGDGVQFAKKAIDLKDMGDISDSSNLHYHEYTVADFNGDGKADILDKGIVNGVGPTYMEIRYSTGTSFVTGHFNSEPSGLGYISENRNMLGDYDGDGHLEIAYGIVNSPTFHLFKFLPEDIHKVQQIINGLNHTTRIDYNTLPLLAKQNKYIRGTGATYPVIDFQKALTVVSKVHPDNGIGGINTTDYAYEGAKIHLRGKGFLGFTKVKTTDLAMGMVSENTYETGMAWLTNPNHPFFQPVLKNSKTYLSAGGNISEKTIDPNTGYTFITGTSTPVSLYLPDNSGKRYHFYASHIMDIDHLHGNTTDITITQNNSGIITSQTTDNGAVQTTITSVPFQSACSWTFDKISSSQTIVTRTGEPPYIRNVNFEYKSNPAGCKLFTQEDPDLGLITKHDLFGGHDVFGNVKSTQVSGPDFPASLTINDYDGLGRFVIKQTNTLGHTAEMTYSDAYGSIITNTDANGLTTSYAYDGFGRLKETTTPTNQKITVTRSWEINTIPNSLYAISTSQPGTPSSKEFYDVLGRVLKTETQGFDGSVIFVNKTYNNLGQLANESEPNDNSLLTTYTYEPDFKRLQIITSPGGTTITYSYSGNTTSILTTAGTSIRNSLKTLDASGVLVTSTDDGGTLSYLYHSSGKPRQITAPGGAITTMTYDAFGRQTQLNDPNAGLMTYTYDVLGQLKTQTDARGNVYNNMIYDALGRMTSKTGPEGTITYTYDTKPNGKGMIASVTGFNGINSDYTYDSQSRLASKTEQNIDGNNYAFNYQYDNLNRVTQITYPSGFAVKRNYNNIGYLEKINKTSDNNLVWQCTEMNQRLQVKNALQGNGGTISKTYTNLGFLQNITRTENGSPAMDWTFGFNPLTGNLDNRSNNLQGLSETFTYDELDRLTNISQSNQSQQISYLPSGNIASKSDAGTTYNYATLPHAVSTIDNPTSDIPVLQQDITYTAFQKAENISENNLNLHFTYGPDYARKISLLSDNQNNTLRKIIYVGNYEKITVGNNTYEVHYIAGGDGLAAINVKQNNQDQLFYVHTDHLGSIINIYDAAGNFVYAQNFDAWGRERNPNTWTYTANPNTKPEWLIRGYTGHEHHREFNLINMNGRVYDPIVGRMLSPDNYVQGVDFTQAFNRYSYALNNPLAYVDPNGDNPILIAAIIIGSATGGYTGYKIAEAKGYDFNEWQTYGYILGGAAIGGISGYAGATIATSGGFLANTFGIAFSSGFYTMGMGVLSGGMMLPSISFGVASYNFGTREFGYLGKKGNEWYENIGYAFGALANLQDIVAGFNGVNVDVHASNTTIEKGSIVPHSYVRNPASGEIYISVANQEPVQGDTWWKFIRNAMTLKNKYGAEYWMPGEIGGWKMPLYNINEKILRYMQQNIQSGERLLGGGTLRWGGFAGCVNQTGRALWYVGIPTLPINLLPSWLNAQLFIRQMGILASPYLTTYKFEK